MFAAPHAGQLKGSPVRSLLTNARTCAGLYVFGRGLRILSYEMSNDCSIGLAVVLGTCYEDADIPRARNESAGGSNYEY